MSQLPELTLRCEAQMTNPPLPTGFGVMLPDGRLFGVLRVEYVREALARYDEMMREWESRRPT